MPATMYAEKTKGYTYEMAFKGFKAGLRRATKLPNTGRPHGLPQGTPIPVFPVDALPGCPEDWMRGPGNFVCPANPNEGLWFDWTQNDHYNTAVLPSVKGMNPITGQKLEGFKLEKYEEKCPLHGEPFKDGLFCEKCNYKWPPQSYVSYPNTLWWDGFRQPDGKVRQFFFTEDEARDIASLVIGKENTVPAFGFAFYEPIKPRVVSRGGSARGIGGQAVYCMSAIPVMYGSKLGGSSIGGQSLSSHKSYMSQPTMDFCSNTLHDGHDVELSCCAVEPKVKTSGFPGNILRSVEEPVEAVKSVAVGAGAEILQDLDVDSLKVTEWKDEPSAVMRLYFVFEKQFKQIVKKGVKDITGDKEGYLKGLPVG